MFRVAARTFARPASQHMSRIAVRALGTPSAPPSKAEVADPEIVVVDEVFDSLEWTLSSPPPIHQFEEPPIIVETAHLLPHDVPLTESDFKH
ncbi:hypothetical protein JKP88DRAFT_194263 [Tribonema minus]|uniref:Uncharacterized protein n=1 Tax=Tribonema minus TaxID=303371 RepID=A0A835Z9C3_9STRA|nr:hypothetical protein JKP88DRAFT_194263 [Tribonema minus]